MAQSDGHDAPWLIDEIVVGFEDAIGEPIVAQELPDVFRPGLARGISVAAE